ncbi:ectoine hydroxylase-related dioxygenase (phytanoyl-CoA dioxygenase family) [Labrenzia sp. EL_142]|nr:ectoine hydroxylase-related dioxygenase (phytanoyl-CoA dioxygenase family) [Labrenzia sp. EL_142]
MSEAATTQSPIVEQIIINMNETGYCVVPEVLSRDEAQHLSQIVLDLQEQENRQDTVDLGHCRVLHLLAKNPVFVQLLAHPLVIAVNEAYLGEDCVCSTFSSNCAFPGSDLTYWHCDHPYWTIAQPFQTDPPLTAHAIWCLTDMSEATGGTKFVPGSQLYGRLPEHKGNYDPLGHTPEALAGSVIFAHGATWHSAGRNESEMPRIGVFVRYARSFLIPQEDMKAQLPYVPEPSDLVQRLMGAKQYQPQGGYPY